MEREEPLRLGDYEIHRAWEGFASIRQISSGEIMHSRTDPIQEARQLYVEQSGLAVRLQAESLILWDVGLGAAANAMAAIECYEESSSTRPFRIVVLRTTWIRCGSRWRTHGAFPTSASMPRRRS